MPTKPRAPKGLLTRGRALWKAIHRDFQPTPAEAQILHELCRTLDEIDTLSAALAQSGSTVTGSHGQPRANPIYAELRQHRATADRLALALGLTDTTSRRR